MEKQISINQRSPRRPPYLFARFPSPHSNNRGGDGAVNWKPNQEICRPVRKQVKPKYPVMIKLGGDGFPGRYVVEDLLT